MFWSWFMVGETLWQDNYIRIMIVADFWSNEKKLWFKIQILVVVSIPNKTIAIWRLDPLLFETVVPKMSKCLNIISYFYHVFFFHSQCHLYKHDTYRYWLLKSLPCRHPSPRLKLDRNLFILWHNNTTSI